MRKLLPSFRTAERHVEGLEARRLLAGDVTAVVSVDPATNLPTLFVTGDDAANGVQITRALPGQFVLTGLPDGNGVPTTVNGQASTTIKTATAGITIVVSTGGGDDQVVFGTATVPASARGLTIDTGNGADTVTVRNAVIAGDLVIETGRGDDSVTVRSVTTSDPIYAGVPAPGTGQLRINTGQGVDQVAVGGLFGAFIAFGGGSGIVTSSSARKVTVVTDRADDRVEITGFFAGSSEFSGGRGEDVLINAAGAFTPFGPDDITGFETLL